jgi:hypothetical protein
MIALRRAGCAVTVYERSRGKLEERGAGIGMPLTLLRTLIERDLVDAGMAHFHAAKAPFVLRADPEDGERGQGRLLWEQPSAAAVTNWPKSRVAATRGNIDRTGRHVWVYASISVLTCDPLMTIRG